MAKRRSARVDFETAREIALVLPGVEEGTSYGTPALRVRKKLFARLWEDGETLVIRVDFDQREALLEADPKAFFLTDHYRSYPMMLVRLPVVARAPLEDLLVQAWRGCASKRQLAEYQRGRV